MGESIEQANPERHRPRELPKFKFRAKVPDRFRRQLMPFSVISTAARQRRPLSF
jgi:hypothetical protein